MFLAFYPSDPPSFSPAFCSYDLLLQLSNTSFLGHLLHHKSDPSFGSIRFSKAREKNSCLVDGKEGVGKEMNRQVTRQKGGK